MTDTLASSAFVDTIAQVTLEQINALYNFGQFQYTYGNYSGAADYLYHFRILSTDPDLTISAHWGKLACDILTGKWDVALEELNSLREAIDARAPSMPQFASPSSSNVFLINISILRPSPIPLARLLAKRMLGGGKIAVGEPFVEAGAGSNTGKRSFIRSERRLQTGKDQLSCSM